MTFDESMREVALAADKAVELAMKKYASGGASDEPEITGYLLGQLDAQIEGRIGGLTWNTQIVRNKAGTAAEERRVGADLLIHVSLDTPSAKYSKGVLVQAKRAEPDESISTGDLQRLSRQCKTMLTFTPSAFVFNYARGSMRCAPATRFAEATDRRLHRQCAWTSYRFFRELFRCPIGDPRITSGTTYDLVPKVIRLRGEGQLSDA
jgi:hypothetical protein